MRWSRLATLAACAVLAGACAAGPASGGLEPERGVPDRQPSAGEPRHPGEHDATRSAAARVAVAACARAGGWDLENLVLSVSDRGLLIGIKYRAVRRGEVAPGEAAPGEAAPGEAAPGEAAPGEAAPGEDETVRRCLSEAGVHRP